MTPLEPEHGPAAPAAAPLAVPRRPGRRRCQRGRRRHSGRGRNRDERDPSDEHTAAGPERHPPITRTPASEPPSTGAEPFTGSAAPAIAGTDWTVAKMLGSVLPREDERCRGPARGAAQPSW